MTECIFCKIVKGEIPCTKVYEDKDNFAFLDINPVNEGHVLLVPKKHYEWMYDVPDKEIGKMFIQAKGFMTAIKKATKADYVVISVLGVDVPHFHIHIIPRYFNDKMPAWPTKKYKEGEADTIASKIKSLLK